jgi:site-specific recombinase XerD
MDTPDLVDRFLKTLSTAQTRRAYRTDLRRFFENSAVARAEVQRIDASGIRAFVRRMRRRRMSLSTQRRRLSALRAFFDWLVTSDLVPHNPARHPKVSPLPPDSNDDASDRLGRTQIHQLVEAATAQAHTGLRDRALITTIVYGALRRGEVAALRVQDVRPLGRYWVLDLPDDATGRYVQVPDVVVEEIEALQKTYDITDGPLWRSVSRQNAGAPLTPDGVYKAVRRVARRAGVADVTIDALRQAGLRLALDGGADLAQVQAHGRFSDSASAAQLYEDEDPAGALGDSAAAYIDLDIKTDSSDA